MATALDVKALKYQLDPYQRSQAARDLRAAADLIERVGWFQKEAEGPNGELCLSTALGKVTGAAEAVAHDLHCRQCLALTAISKYTGMMAVAWNDDETMTKESILAGIRSCAEWLDKLARED